MAQQIGSVLIEESEFTREGLYNVDSGLRNWRQSSAYLKGDRANAGAGGVDVVVLGDSIFAGTGSSYAPVDKMTNRLRQLLQNRLNPVDIVGGYGFMNAMALGPSLSSNFANFSGGNYNAGASALWSAYGRAASYTGEAGDSKGICRRHFRAAGTADPNQTALWVWPKSIRVNHNYQASTTAMQLTQKQAQVVYSKNPGDGRFQTTWASFSATTPPYVGFPPSSGTPVAVDANSYIETVDCDGTEGVGFRSELADVVVKTDCTDYIQIDPLDVGESVSIEGIIFYTDDYNKGLRLHDLTCGGLNSSDYNDPVTLAGLARFGERSGVIAGQNSTNAKCVIIELGTNDLNASIFSESQYKTNLEILIKSILAWNSKPSIILCYPPAVNSAAFYNSWQKYINAGKSLCDKYDLALINFWEKTGNAAHGGNAAGGYMYDRGFYYDGIHYLKTAQDWMAQEIFSVMTYGV